MCVDPWFHGPVCDGSCAESPHAATVSGVSSPTGSNACAIDSQAEDEGRPHGADTPGRPSNLTGDEAVMHVSQGVRQAAADMLEIHREWMERERRTTLHLIQAARRAGMTNAEIGQRLGMTEGGVRMMVQRAEARS